MTGVVGGTASLRLASRLARRETMRRPWRTLLVALLVAMPVAGMAVAAVWVRTDRVTPLESWRHEFGNADMYSSPASSPSTAPGEEPRPLLSTLLPDGARVVSQRTAYQRLLRTTDGRRTPVEITDLPMTDPMAAPIMQVVRGRAPQRADEVFLTRAVAKDLGVKVGDVLHLVRPAAVEWTVVGVGERRSWWDAEVVVLGPGTPFSWRGTSTSPTMQMNLIDLPAGLTVPQLSALAMVVDGVAFRPGLLPSGTPGSISASTESAAGGVAWSWVIGAVVLTVVGIVIAAAFAAGARRQLATLGQLAANGASPAVLRRVLFLQGTWTGVIGTALGFVLAAAALAGLAPQVDNIFNRDVGQYTVRLLDLIPAMALGIGAATLAALVPARTTARVPVLAALAGRRPLRPVPAWLAPTGAAVATAGLALLGLAVLGGNGSAGGGSAGSGSEGGGSAGSGSVWALTGIAGGVAVLLGACAIAPGYVSVLEPIAARLRGAWRLAARSLARQRTRTSAVVSAVCATTALAIGASALVLSAHAQDQRRGEWMRNDEVVLDAALVDSGPPGQSLAPTHRPSWVPEDVLGSVVSLLPGSQASSLTGLGAANGIVQWEVRTATLGALATEGSSPRNSLGAQTAALVDDALLARYNLPREGLDALAKDGILVIGSGHRAGTVTVLAVETSTGIKVGQPSPDSAPAALGASGLLDSSPLQVTSVPEGDRLLGSLPRVLLTAERAAALGLQLVPGPTLVRAPLPLTNVQRGEVQDAMDEARDAAMDAASGPTISIDARFQYPSSDIDPRLLEALLTTVAFLLSLFVVAVSLALAAAETRDERDVLVVVGAPAPTMRKAGSRKAMLLTFLGAALAVPVGFLPVAVFTAASKDNIPLVFPWRTTLLLLVAVPLLAGAVTNLCSGLALRWRPVTVSTMAFD
jgi:putative ABC transport system permease protein